MKNIEDVNILVVGDIMLDKYVMGEVERISPEAPVPIVHVQDEYATLGGCGNTARNITSLGANVMCLASVGKDNYADVVIEQLNENNIKSAVFLNSEETTVKERIVASERKIQMIRIDRETNKKIDHEFALTYLKQRMNDCEIEQFDFIVISDYNKGMITPNLISGLKKLKTRIIVDPKPRNVHYYNGVYMMTPNAKEWGMIKENSRFILNSPKYILVTRGKDGMVIFEPDKDTYRHIKGNPVDVYNVSGAGDTVVAVMSVCMSMGLDPYKSAAIANKCAAYVVTKPGTSVVSENKFMKIYHNEVK